MDDIPLVVDEDVAVVSVLDLEEIGNQRVGCLRFDKVVPGLLKIDIVLGTEFVDEVLVEGLLVNFTNPIS